MSTHPSVSPRFDAKSIGEEVDRGRVHKGLTVEQAADLLGIGRTHWYDKADGTKPFKWHEVGKLAALWRAPPGWPIATWNEGLAWQDHLDEVEKKSRDT